MSITPLNITTTGDSGTAYVQPKSVSKPDPVVSTTAPTAAQPARRSSENDIADAVDKLNSFAQSNATDLSFSQDKETGITIIKVVDTVTDKVVRQIPTEEAVSISKSLEKMRGLLFNDKA